MQSGQRIGRPRGQKACPTGCTQRCFFVVPRRLSCRRHPIPSAGRVGGFHLSTSGVPRGTTGVLTASAFCPEALVRCRECAPAVRARRTDKSSRSHFLPIPAPPRPLRLVA